eukprot:GHVS01070892.1.p1 GENE.GHVS01070892.1~~GHVS01070892.1.p1  ORF type:complete len:358 (+),score=21.82 GHVS01070892.1:77-1075(+)
MKDLIETSDTIFTGSTPTLRQIGILRQKLNKCSLADLGYTQDSLKSAMLKPHEWRELHFNSMPPHVIPVHSAGGYHIVAFVLPHQSGLELHDHIGMLVIGSVLLGCAKFTTYHVQRPLDELSDAYTVVNEDRLDKSDLLDPIEQNDALRRKNEMATYLIEESTLSNRSNSVLNETMEIDPVGLLDGYGKESHDAKCFGNLFLCEKVFDGSIKLEGATSEAEDRSNLPKTGVATTAIGRSSYYKRLAEEALYGRRSAIILPSICNIHEIRSTDELTVMLDILSPPYGPKRECRYFRVINTDNITGDPELRVLERCEYGGPDYFHELPFLGEFS